MLKYKKGGAYVKKKDEVPHGYRHENKFLISVDEGIEIASKLKGVMKLDPNADKQGKYTISSVYFDNYENKALKASECGVPRREKFRIRAYNGSDGYIKLEKKEKIRDLCRKRSVRITRDVYDNILYGDGKSLLTLNSDVANELYCAIKAEGFRPVTVVEYERRVFIYPVSDVRITIDTNIKGSSVGVDMFRDSDTFVPTLSPVTAVLEIKYNEFLPDFIRSVIPHTQITKQTSVCKYVFGRTYK